VETFRKRFKTLFPILLDENSDITRSLNVRATPITMVVSTEDVKVLFTHAGIIPDADSFVKQVKFVKQVEVMGK
jgi:hypothetical protein